jgi:hypothetical protein
LENKVPIPVFNYNTEQIFTSPTGIGGGGGGGGGGGALYEKRHAAVGNFLGELEEEGLCKLCNLHPKRRGCYGYCSRKCQESASGKRRKAAEEEEEELCKLYNLHPRRKGCYGFCSRKCQESARGKRRDFAEEEEEVER